MRQESVRVSPEVHKTTVCLYRWEQGIPEREREIAAVRGIVLVGCSLGCRSLAGGEDLTI